MKSITLEDIILQSADISLNVLEENNFYIAGVNGPHAHADTPVRNTAHWLLINAKAYEITDHPQYFTACEKALKYLLSKDARPYHHTFIQRTAGGTDKCNGVIGQAWVIEALIKAATITKNDEALNLALNSFLMLPFDKRIGMWRKVEIDGSVGGFDLTLNHQIWFAAAGSYLIRHNVLIKQHIIRFLDRLTANISIDYEGCFKMPVRSKTLLWRGYPLCAIRTTELYKKLRGSKKRGKEVDVGYHAFHLYGLAMIKENIPEHKIWSSEGIKKTLQYMMSKSYESEVMQSKYGLGYNPPGFEVAFALQVFSNIIDDPSVIENKIIWWLGQQIEKTFDFDSGLMNKVQYDPVTYAARLYEATRLKGKYLKTNLLI